MRKIVQENLSFVFQDADGVLTFTIDSHEEEPDSPRFLFDGEKQIFLLRKAGHIISLNLEDEAFIPVLKKADKVRFLETPEDSSNIVRQFDALVTKIEKIDLHDSQLISFQEEA